jgi:hypothetical protein
MIRVKDPNTKEGKAGFSPEAMGRQMEELVNRERSQKL